MDSATTQVVINGPVIEISLIKALCNDAIAGRVIHSRQRATWIGDTFERVVWLWSSEKRVKNASHLCTNQFVIFFFWL